VIVNDETGPVCYTGWNIGTKRAGRISGSVVEGHDVDSKYLDFGFAVIRAPSKKTDSARREKKSLQAGGGRRGTMIQKKTRDPLP